jgi:hypothetical protein
MKASSVPNGKPHFVGLGPIKHHVIERAFHSYALRHQTAHYAVQLVITLANAIQPADDKYAPMFGGHARPSAIPGAGAAGRGTRSRLRQ